MAIVEFLEARLAEDERIAKATGEDATYGFTWPNTQYELRSSELIHIRRHDPARALAEVAAKRGILEAHAGRSPRSSDFCRICEDPYTYGPEAWPCDTVRYLASIYKDHPDFNKHTEGGWTI